VIVGLQLLFMTFLGSNFPTASDDLSVSAFMP
jgi:hypothetical protein